MITVPQPSFMNMTLMDYFNRLQQQKIDGTYYFPINNFSSPSVPSYPYDTQSRLNALLIKNQHQTEALRQKHLVNDYIAHSNGYFRSQISNFSHTPSTATFTQYLQPAWSPHSHEFDAKAIGKAMTNPAIINIFDEYIGRSYLASLEEASIDDPTLLEKLNQQKNLFYLANPMAKLADSLGLPFEIDRSPPIQITEGDTLEQLQNKINEICYRIETNKSFWSRAFHRFDAPTTVLNPSVNPSFLEQRTIEGVTPPSENLTDQEKLEHIQNEIFKLYEERQKIQFAKEKHAIITNSSSNSFDNTISIPFLENPQDHLNSYQRAIEDYEHLAFFQQNQIMHPEGSPHRLSEDYLEKNIQGPPKGVKANLAYFTGHLNRCLQDFTFNFSGKFKNSCQIIGHFLDPNTHESFQVATTALDATIPNKGLSEQVKTAFEIAKLADQKSIAVQIALQKGADKNALVEDIHSAILAAGTTGKPELVFHNWEKKLLNVAKGALHGLFDYIQPHKHFETLSFYTGIDALENILPFEQRLELNLQMKLKAQKHASSVDHFFQKLLKIDPTNPNYISGKQLSTAVMDIGLLTTGGVSLLKNMRLANLPTVANKYPHLVNRILNNSILDSGNRIIKFKVDKTGAFQSNPNFLKVCSYDKMHLQMNFLHGPDLAAMREASIILHKNAKIILEPYLKRVMPEMEARKIIEKTGIPTFPRPQGIPENFLVKISDNGAGMIYIDPINASKSVRVMPGKPHNRWPSQQKPYVIQRIGENALDKHGNKVNKTTPEAHIPLEEFIYKD